MSLPNPLDLVRSRDGSLSLTKLAATTFHVLIALTVAWVTWLKQDFVESMWLLYSAVAVGHAVVDKTGAQITAFKDKKLEVESQPGALR
jgi:hypothetical protein